MIVSFEEEGAEDIFNGKNTKAARKTCPKSLWKIAVRKLDQLDSVTTLNELQIPPGNGLEALRGDREGQHSIRINDQRVSRGPTPARIKSKSWTITEPWSQQP